jgi:hypothetical protein
MKADFSLTIGRRGEIDTIRRIGNPAVNRNLRPLRDWNLNSRWARTALVSQQHEAKAKARPLIINEQDTYRRRSASVQIGIRAPYSFNENFSFLAGSPRC